MYFTARIPRSDIPDPYGSSIFVFLWNLHTNFHTVYTRSHVLHQWIKVSFSPHPSVIVCVLHDNIAILTGVRQDYKVCFNFYSRMAKDIEHLFKYLLTICLSAFENLLLNSPSFPFIPKAYWKCLSWSHLDQFFVLLPWKPVSLAWPELTEAKCKMIARGVVWGRQE